MAWKAPIVARHHAHVTNGPTEAINNLVKRVKRVAFGSGNGSSISPPRRSPWRRTWDQLMKGVALPRAITLCKQHGRICDEDFPDRLGAIGTDLRLHDQRSCRTPPSVGLSRRDGRSGL